MYRILLVDDDDSLLDVAARLLEPIATEVVCEQRAEDAIRQFREGAFDIVVCDIKMPGQSGIDVLRAIREVDIDQPVVLVTGHASLDSAIEAIDLGASGYVLKPFSGRSLRRTVEQAIEVSRLRRENRTLRRALNRGYVAGGGMIGDSPALRAVQDAACQFAIADVDVLIVGETGTGKELVARLIHEAGGRSQGPFVPVDCGAIPETLFEAEFFGHEKGAYTGATTRSSGLFELADKGVLFLDEVLSLPLPMQARLLRALQQRQIRRVGGKQLINVDVQVIAACNRDPLDEVKAGGLREDLYYRLNVGRIDLPPLRDRRDDIAGLAEHFVDRAAQRMGKRGIQLPDRTREVLEQFSWPGNVRELENVLYRAVALTPSDSDLELDRLPPEVTANHPNGHAPAAATSTPGASVSEREPIEIAMAGPESGLPYQDLRDRHVARFEREYLHRLLLAHGGDATACMQAAGIPRATFYRMLKKHDIDPSDYRK